MGRLQAADRSSDLVVSFQVLEHVRDLGLYLLVRGAPGAARLGRADAFSLRHLAG